MFAFWQFSVNRSSKKYTALASFFCRPHTLGAKAADAVGSGMVDLCMVGLCMVGFLVAEVARRFPFCADSKDDILTRKGVPIICN